MEKSRKQIAYIAIITGALILFGLIILSITLGNADISIHEIIQSFVKFEPSNTRHILIRDLRLPRVITACVVGIALAVSGAIMQGLTRNPLADSGLMGLSAGARFATAMAFAFMGNLSYSAMVGITFLGTTLGAGMVYGISYLVPGGNKPMKLVLAGAAVSTFLTAVSQGIGLIMNMSQGITFWNIGSVTGATWGQLKIALPVVCIATFIAIIISKHLSIINMGEEIALGLGINTGLLKAVGIFTVVILTGISVALAGLISFVGLLIPHFCRHIVGPDYRLIIPTSIVAGAILVVLADIGGKTLNAPGELPISALIAIIGVPSFIYIARRGKGAF